MPFDTEPSTTSPETVHATTSPCSDASDTARPAPSTRFGWLGRIIGRARDTRKANRTARAITLLRNARALIADEKDWIQGVYERDGRRCAIGALMAASRKTDRTTRRLANERLLRVAREVGYHSVESMNDSSSHKEVLAMFDAAIALK